MTDEQVQTASPVVRRVRAYFAAVDRTGSGETEVTPAAFDSVAAGRFALHAPPSPWVDLGWVHEFARASATRIEPLRAGSPAATKLQVRTEIEATVGLSFETWGKLQLALAAGTQQLNLLMPRGPVELSAGSSATVLQVSTVDAASFTAGDWIAVDNDYTGQTGYVGAGISGAYVRTPLDDLEYVRRVTCNVARVAAVDPAGGLTLQTSLPAGAPTEGMRVAAVAGFCDRDGSSFFQEWSGLFVLEGEQGERVLLLYPRLQTLASSSEDAVLKDGLSTVRLAGRWRALPVRDAIDGETVVCYRTFLPA